MDVGEDIMLNAWHVRAKSLLWLLGAIAASFATYWHFTHGSFVWALTDIPFVLLIIYAFWESIRGEPREKQSSNRDLK
jgi:hypothetical protein